MAQTDIVEWAESPYGFYTDRYYDQAKARWVLKPSPIKLAEYHARILRHCFRFDEAGRLPFDTVCIAEPAKSGKSALCGLIAEYIGLHTEGNSSIIMASNKQSQAGSIMYKSLIDSIAYNPHLPNVDPAKYEVTFSNGNSIKAIPSNSRGAAGERFTLACFDELWGYTYEDAQRLWAEHKSDPTRQVSLKLAVGYGGYSDSDLWQGLLETGLKGQPVEELADIINDDGTPTCWSNGRLFVFWSHRCRQPWQTQQWLDSQQQQLTSAEYRRMIQCEFVAATQDAFVSPEMWDACYDPRVKSVAAGDTTPIVLALDLAMGGSLTGDNIALAGVARWGERDFAVKFAERWQPSEGARFDYDVTVGPKLDWLLNNAAIMQLAYDPYQAQHYAQQYQGRVWTKEFSQTNERAMADKHLYDLIVSRRLHHDGNPILRQHVLNAGAKSTDDGRLRLVKTHPFKKIDLAVAVSMSAFRCSQYLLPGDPAADVPLSTPSRASELQAAMSGNQDAAQHLQALGYDIWHGGQQQQPPAPALATNGGGPVRIKYQGHAAAGSFPLMTIDGPALVEHDAIYTVTAETLANLQAHFPPSWFVRL